MSKDLATKTLPAEQNSGHTPGPWRVPAMAWERALSNWTCQIHAGTAAIPLNPATAQGMTEREAQANARLIAAAPDLLAALRAVVASVDCGALLLNQGQWNYSAVKSVDAARAAIAKAKGA